jgi:4-alpha-glucanotransferase
MGQWTELAAQWGIEPGYFDVQGRWHGADPEAVQQVLATLSAAGHRPAGDLHQARQPEPAFQGNGSRMWVLGVQLYAVRSRRNLGHGDFTDLAALLEIVADLGGAGIGLNPLHALFYDAVGSPYAPSSRLFLNPLYIDIEGIEEFRQQSTAALAAQIDRLRAAELIDYVAVAELKLWLLRGTYREFAASGSEARRADFESYRRERGRPLQAFAVFETLRGLYPGDRRLWPAALRRPTDETLRDVRATYSDEVGFHEFLQWNAERQFARCCDIARQRGMAVGPYLDLAVGVHPDGADAWMGQDALLTGLSVGAPPDQFNPAGQDWGLTAYSPHALAATDFEPFRQMLSSAMRHAGAARIDHVLGLMRLFVVPHGVGAARGVYLRMPLATMLSVVAEESRRWSCIVIGEDLGTVPDGFRETMAAWGLWSYLVMMFERNWHGDGSFKPPEQYRTNAIATFNTHDLATFSGWMNGHDLAVKHAIGINPGETEQDRDGSRAALLAALGKPQARFEDVAAYLAATPTRLVSIGIEDVLELADQVNVPGTVDQHPNWRRRWPVVVEELAGDQRLRRIAETFWRAGRGSAS